MDSFHAYTKNIIKLKPLGELCPAELIYGEDSPEVTLLKHFRDAVLAKTGEGRQLIELYYTWSPWITEALKQSKELKEEVQTIIEEIIPLTNERPEIKTISLHYSYQNSTRKGVLPMSPFSPHRIKAGILFCSLFIFFLFRAGMLQLRIPNRQSL